MQKEFFIREQGYYAEVSAGSFCNANKDRSIIRIENLTEDEIIAFRKKHWLSKESITYASIKEQNDKYTILFNKNEMLHNANKEDAAKIDTKNLFFFITFSPYFLLAERFAAFFFLLYI